MSRTKESLVHILEIVTGDAIAGIFQDTALLVSTVTSLVFVVIYLLNGEKNG